MKKLIQAFLRKKTTTFTDFPIVLFFSTRNKDGNVIAPEVFKKWLFYVTDTIPTTLDCLSDTVKNYSMTNHYQIIEEMIEVVCIQSSNDPIKTDELERIIVSLLKFGEHTNQSTIRYEVNGIVYHLPI